MDLDLKKQILDLKFTATDTENFITKVNDLYKEKGVAVLQHLFQLLAGIEVQTTQCQSHWKKLLTHRNRMIQELQRDIDVTTAISDYLQSSTDFLDQPRLIETIQYENVVNESNHDKLTGLFNRNYFDEAFRQQFSLAKRYHNDLTILFIDIDNFKTINDSFGHLAGDKALQQISKTIQQSKRDSDICARFGGEEFVILMPQTDNISGFVYGERLRKLVSRLEIMYLDQKFKLTISGGIASYPINTKSSNQLLEMADNAVYLSKGAGKNRITNFKEEKRRYLRVDIDKNVLVKKVNFDNSETHHAMSKNICVGGILFENDIPFSLGSLIQVQVPVSQGKPVILIGQVVRIEAFKNGKYDIGMNTSFREMDIIANREIAAILPGEKL